MTNSAYSDQLASSKPTDLDLHCLLRQGISGFSRSWSISVVRIYKEKYLNGVGDVKIKIQYSKYHKIA